MIGLSQLSIARTLVLAMIGRLPGVFVSCWVGRYAAELPWWMWIPMGGGAIALAWIFWRYQEWLEDWMVRLVQRLTG